MDTRQRENAGRLNLGYIGDPANLGGILRIECVIASDAGRGAELWAQVRGRPDEPTALGQAEPGSVVLVGIHFALLPEGPNELSFTLSEPDGSISTIAVTIEVDQASPLGIETARLLRQAETPVFFIGPCDAVDYPYGIHSTWFDKPDAHQHVDRLLARGEISELEAGHLRHFLDRGFMVVEGLMDEALVDAVNSEIDDAISKKYQDYEMGSSRRIEHLHMHYPRIRELWLDKRHRRYADLIFGAASRPCQTLTYVFGSQQDAHQDTVHLTPFPAGYMCGTWIALQDVQPDSGELVVYPGSHRERRVYMGEAGCAKVEGGDWAEFIEKVCSVWSDMTTRHEPFIYRPRKGTVLIWHENLLHAGSVRIDQSLERRSIVIHSFADGALAFYDSTGLAGTAVKRSELTAR
jgi:hypothetical protein